MSTKGSKKFRTDPITLSIIHYALLGVTEEMSITMFNTSRSPILSTSRDFGCGVTNAKGDMIAISAGVTIHSTGLDYAVRGVKEYFGTELSPGDIIMCNDPHKPFYCTGHLGDFTTIAPVFYDGELVFWCVERGHQAETGGMTPGSQSPKATDIRMEGFRMSPIKLYEGGKLRRDVFDLVLHQLRAPALIRGDILASIGTVKTGERRLLALINRYGLKMMKDAAEDLLDSSEMMMRERIAKLPAGTYSTERWMDGDAQGGPYVVRVTVSVQGDSLTIDWTGSDPQSKGSCNSTLGNTHSATFTALLPTVAKGLPINDGITRPVRLIAPEGSIVNARAPAPTGLGTCHPYNEMVNCVFGAISQFGPQYAMADWDRASAITAVGIDPRTRSMFSSIESQTRGGAGATWGCDGWSHIGYAASLGGTAGSETEMYEAAFPHFLLGHRFVKDSGGPGKWRGGLGSEYFWKSEAEWGIITPWADGQFTPGRGAVGGKPPQPPYDCSTLYFYKKDGTVCDARRKGVYNYEPGDIFHHLSTGGGGVGDPLERDPQDVKRDVMDEFISIEAAKREYGVVFKQDKWPYDIAYEKTEKLRKEMKQRSVNWDAIHEKIRQIRADELRKGLWLAPPAGGPEDWYRTETPLE